MGENRTSGRDTFEVTINQVVQADDDKKNDPDNRVVREIPCEIIDNDSGFYNVRYQVEEECDVNIKIEFLNDKGHMVPIRGSPFQASFRSGATSKDNLLTGPAMDKNIKKELDRLNELMLETKKELNTKDIDLKNVKKLLRVKEYVEGTMANTDIITLNIDQLDESLKLF